MLVPPDDVDGHVGFLERLDDADVGDPVGPAAAEDEPDGAIREPAGEPS
jgi:hypothetical protein